MNTHESVDGVVIRVWDGGDHNRYLSVLTADAGRITMLAKGSHSLKSSQMGVSQPFTYGNFEYYRRGDFNILKGGSVLRSFHALSGSIDLTNLAFYLCDVIREVTDEGEPARDQLRLLLNSLYALCENRATPEKVKAAFELRIAAMSGYLPETLGCGACGNREDAHYYLDVMNGTLLCSECMTKRGNRGVRPGDYDEIREAEVLCPLSASACAALHYCIHAPLERLFSFDLQEESDWHDLSRAAQTYLLSHLERGFDSLTFYLTLRQPTAPQKERKL
jgi:DNA repair protein RecO (recombination protein O)